MDKTDRIILTKLQKDARRSFKKIADEINVSEATVSLRVKKLQESGIIKGFKAILDPSLVGKSTTAIMMLKADPKLYNRVLQNLLRMSEVCEIYDVTGPYYTIIKIRAKNTEELTKIIDKIGSINGINVTETSVVLRTIREDASIIL